MLLNDDYPHATPRRAWLRWRENWLYFLLDPEQNVFLTAHMSLQPTFGIARYACNLVIDGERFSHAEEVPIPDGLTNSKSIKLGPLEVEFLDPQKSFRVRYDGPDHAFEMNLRATLPLFDYSACVETNPDEFSLSESTSQGFGTFRHQNQTMTGDGFVRFKTGDAKGEERKLSGTGYRDHSWGMRDDNHAIRHTWAWMAFADSTVHVTHFNSQFRPELWAKEGYIGRPEGNLALTKSIVDFSGSIDDGLPANARFEVEDAMGNSVIVTADISEAYARNRFMATRPGSQAYVMRHNFCKCVRESDGAVGIAMLEIGASESSEDGVLSAGKM